jgi:hypothetical protein
VQDRKDRSRPALGHLLYREPYLVGKIRFVAVTRSTRGQDIRTSCGVPIARNQPGHALKLQCRLRNALKLSRREIPSERPTSNQLEQSLKIASLSGLLTLLVALGIIFVGVREFFYPSIGARGFGVPLLDPADGDLLAIKASRDVVTGILVLAFLSLRERRFLPYALDGSS